MTVPSRDWRDDAACRDASLDIFITEGDREDEPSYPTPQALEFCNHCKVKIDCFQFAVDNNEVGIWGGTTTYQRNQLGRERKRAHCPNCGSADLIYENSIELCLSCGMSWHII